MERPDDETIAYYERSIPADPRAKRGQMFGHPCAFVNGNMFYGTFAQSVVVRVGEARTKALAKGKLRVFMPMEGRAWKEYVQVDRDALPDRQLQTLATEALEWTAALPPKAKKAPAAKAAAKKPAAKKKA
jgi:TfoX/Sxy family transcriptional regulator of competence genes